MNTETIQHSARKGRKYEKSWSNTIFILSPVRIATILQGSDDDPSWAGAKRRRPREAQIHNSDGCWFQGAEIFGDKSPADEMMP